MSIKRVMAIGFIFIFATAAWIGLGTIMELRSSGISSKLDSAVIELWGSEICQQAPELQFIENDEVIDRPIIPSAASLDIKLSIDHRRKGLIWYPTYVCSFDGKYDISNHEDTPKEFLMTFAFPQGGSTYDEFALYENEERIRLIVDPDNGLKRSFTLYPGESRTLRYAYLTRGMREWQYVPVAEVNQVRGLNLTVTTDFTDIDYVQGSLSSMTITPAGSGLKLTWEAEDLLTDRSIGVILPEKLNPGPLTSRMTFFAPVCLFFFFILIGTINIISKVNIHPMHYLFVACGFFAFHLMMAYLVDVLDVHKAFIASTIISVGLVTYYLRAALGNRFPWKTAADGQLFFLVIFSYSFFVKGMTGLTVASGSVITLAAIMSVTAKLNWTEVFSRDEEVSKLDIPKAITD